MRRRARATCDATPRITPRTDGQGEAAPEGTAQHDDRGDEHLGWTLLSDASLKRVWDNDADAAYDHQSRGDEPN
jgi:hypothetical protein